MLSYIKTPISFAAWFCISLVFTLLCIPLTYLPAPKRYTNRLYFFLTTVWNKLLLIFSFIHIKVRGEEHLPKFPDAPAIIICNHTSALDIFALEHLVGTYPHIWLTKASYTKIPLFSILLKRMHVPVERDNALAAGKAFLKIYKQAKGLSSHIMLFPEGRRHSDGKIHEFNHGFALLAKKLNRPVIPVKITGLHEIFPKGTALRANKFPIDYHAARPTLTVGKPMVIQENESIDDFAHRVREWYFT